MSGERIIVHQILVCQNECGVIHVRGLQVLKRQNHIRQNNFFAHSPKLSLVQSACEQSGHLPN